MQQSSGWQCIGFLTCVMLSACGGGNSAKNTTQASAVVPINTAGWSDSPFISGDGQRLYFMYSRWNFFPTFTGGLPVLLGPMRPGLHTHNQASDAYLESDIYVATRQASGTWGEPVAMPFNSVGGDSSGMEVGNSFYYVYTAPGGNPDIYVTTKDSQGNWSTPTGLSSAINTSYVEDNPHVSANQDAIWFSSDRPGGYGKKDLYFSYKTNGVWSTPVNLGPMFNTSANEDQPWVDPSDSTLYFNRDGQIFMSSYVNGSYTTPVLFTIPGQPYVAQISFTDDHKYAYFVSSDTTTQRLRIMYIAKQADGTWGPATPVD